MIYRYYRKLRRMVRNWRLDAIRTDRNAVIQRVVAAAARESKERLNGDSTPTLQSPAASNELPQAEPSVVAAQLLGRDDADETIPGELIGRRAHEIWLRNGRPSGTAAQDWIQAEAELRAERRQQS